MKLLIHSQTIRFQTFNGCILEVWKWISNFRSPYIMDVITYPCWDQILFMFIKLTLLFTEIFRYQQEDYFTCCKQQRYLLPRHGTFNYLTQISTQQVKKPVAVHQETIFRKRKNKRAWSGYLTLCIFMAVLRRNHPVQFKWLEKGIEGWFMHSKVAPNILFILNHKSYETRFPRGYILIYTEKANFNRHIAFLSNYLTCNCFCMRYNSRAHRVSTIGVILLNPQGSMLFC